MRWLLLSLPLLFGFAPFTCSPQHSDFGLDVITKMQTPPDDALTCDVPPPSEGLAAERSACAFSIGDRVEKTLGITRADVAKMPIRHVILMMKENRSFDHIYGNLHDEGQPDSEAIPGDFVNLDTHGVPVAPFPLTTTCIPVDPGHQSDSVTLSLTDDMGGFVKNAALTTGTDGHFAMGTYKQSDLPFYYFLATTYALSDRHFAPMASGTFANRNFVLFGHNAGVIDTGITYPEPSIPSILQLLINAGYTWGAYSDSEVFSGTLGWKPTDPGAHTYQQFLDALDNGTLPNVSFVDAVEQVTDDHPIADLQAGEAWSREIYEHFIASPQYSRSVMFFTYDEAGSFADHIVPPMGCLPKPGLTATTQLGPRVPLVAISRWAKKHYVSHNVTDHTAITRFIEMLFDLPAMTARDANAGALLDLFDFSCAQPAQGQTSPEAGTGECEKKVP
jgi:phospholipase C